MEKPKLKESDKLTQLSNKSLGINTLMSQLEIGFLIIIEVFILALIFFPNKEKEAVETN